MGVRRGATINVGVYLPISQWGIARLHDNQAVTRRGAAAMHSCTPPAACCPPAVSRHARPGPADTPPVLH